MGASAESAVSTSRSSASLQIRGLDEAGTFVVNAILGDEKNGSRAAYKTLMLLYRSKRSELSGRLDFGEATGIEKEFDEIWRPLAEAAREYGVHVTNMTDLEARGKAREAALEAGGHLTNYLKSFTAQVASAGGSAGNLESIKGDAFTMVGMLSDWLIQATGAGSTAS